MATRTFVLILLIGLSCYVIAGEGATISTSTDGPTDGSTDGSVPDTSTKDSATESSTAEGKTDGGTTMSPTTREPADQENANAVVVLANTTVQEFDEAFQTNFKKTIADATNRYCGDNENICNPKPPTETTTRKDEKTTAGVEPTSSGQPGGTTISGQPEATTSTVEATTYTGEAATSTGEATTSTVEATTSTVEATTSTVEATTSTDEATTSTVEATTSTVEATTSTVEATTSTVEATTSTVEATTSTVEATTSTVEATTSTVEATTSTETEATSTGGDKPAVAYEVDPGYGVKRKILSWLNLYENVEYQNVTAENVTIENFYPDEVKTESLFRVFSSSENLVVEFSVKNPNNDNVTLLDREQMDKLLDDQKDQISSELGKTVTVRPKQTVTTQAPTTPITSDPETDDGGLEGWEIALIVIGSLIGVALIAGAIFYFCVKKKKRSDDYVDHNIGPTTRLRSTENQYEAMQQTSVAHDNPVFNKDDEIDAMLKGDRTSQMTETPAPSHDNEEYTAL